MFGCFGENHGRHTHVSEGLGVIVTAFVAACGTGVGTGLLLHTTQRTNITLSARGEVEH